MFESLLTSEVVGCQQIYVLMLFIKICYPKYWTKFSEIKDEINQRLIREFKILIAIEQFNHWASSPNLNMVYHGQRNEHINECLWSNF